MKPALQQDWDQYGAACFVIEELERIEKRPEQSDAEFHADIDFMREFWDEKLPQDNRYSS
jgi:hypothetical protein